MSMILKVAYVDYPDAVETTVVDGATVSEGFRLEGDGSGTFWVHGDDGEPVKPGTGPGRNNVAWISDVEQLTVVGEFPCWEEIPKGFRHLTDLEIWAWRGYRREDFVSEESSWYRPHTLVMIRTTDQKTRVLLVERAWLLNGAGDTIDTVAQ